MSGTLVQTQAAAADDVVIPAAVAPAALTPSDGVWRLVTETSAYLLDLDAGTATRLPEQGAGQAAPGFVYVAALRRDAEPIPLLALDPVTIGKPARMLLQIRDDFQTARTTTLVCELPRVPAALSQA